MKFHFFTPKTRFWTNFLEKFTIFALFRPFFAKNTCFFAIFALFLLMAPISLESWEDIGRAISSASHVAIWAAVAWWLLQKMPPPPQPRHAWTLWLALGVLSGLIELAQPLTGRSPEWLDWLLGLAGAGGGCISRRWNRLARGILISLLIASPAVGIVALHLMEALAFPALARPGTIWSAQGWDPNGILTITSTNFTITPDPHASADDYPGLFRSPAQKQWNRMSAVQIQIYWPMPEPALFAFRVDDQKDYPAYSDRVQVYFTVTQSWNTATIPVNEISHTPSGRPLRFNSITRWGVFLVSKTPFDYFSLEAIHLEMKESEP